MKAVDKNSPLIRFVGQHGVSYLGHKRPKMLKDSELQASRVGTILGQCASLLHRYRFADQGATLDACKDEGKEDDVHF